MTPSFYPSIKSLGRYLDLNRIKLMFSIYYKKEKNGAVLLKSWEWIKNKTDTTHTQNVNVSHTGVQCIAIPKEECL
jgi:hypothetical protein